MAKIDWGKVGLIGGAITLFVLMFKGAKAAAQPAPAAMPPSPAVHGLAGHKRKTKKRKK